MRGRDCDWMCDFSLKVVEFINEKVHWMKETIKCSHFPLIPKWVVCEALVFSSSLPFLHLRVCFLRIFWFVCSLYDHWLNGEMTISTDFKSHFVWVISSTISYHYWTRRCNKEALTPRKETFWLLTSTFSIVKISSFENSKSSLYYWYV